MLRLLGVMFALMIMFAPGQAHAVCSSPSGNAGDIIYNATQRIFQYCDDTNWKRMNILPGTGSGGCTSPTLPDGQMVFNADHRILQGCAGNVHRPFTPVKSSGGSVSWKMIATGGEEYSHACGIKTDNTLWCWGANRSGQLGDNTTTMKLVHTQVSGGGSWKFVATGTSHTCGIKADNTLWCWGSNGVSWGARGQLGNNDGSGTVQTAPVAVSGGGTWKYVAAGRSHSCGIKTDDTLWCWGDDGSGQQGNGAGGNVLVPTQVSGGGSWKQVTAGIEHTCGIMSDDTMRCWGNNGQGRLGDGTQTTRQSPTTLSGGGSWKAVTGGQEHTCGIRSDDTIRCWGNNWLGQGGRDPDLENPLLVPTAILGGGTWKKISATHAQHTCAIRSDDTAHCWGFNDEGQGGSGNFNSIVFTPTAVSDSGPWAHISAGAPSSVGFTCGIKTNGSLKCWGSNRQGQLGTNTLSWVGSPMATSASGGWKQVSTGETGSTCAIRVDDTLWCWGQNTSLQLGIGSSVQQVDTPTQISGGGGWSKISMGLLHGCGIKTDNTAWCWGSGSQGQLGNNDNNSFDTPQPVSGGAAWREISSGIGWNASTCGIRTDDTLWCWGNDSAGQLGNGAGGNSQVPVQVSSGTFWKKISVGGEHACGIRTDDSLYCWGSDGSAQLGNGATSTNQQLPVLISSGTTWKAVTASPDFTCGVRLTDDTMLCWGNNNGGNLGDNSFTQRNVPTPVNGGGTWNHVDGGGYNYGSFSCGLRLDGTAWCWGVGGAGNLGDGNFGGAGGILQVPTAVVGGHTWKQISSAGGNNENYTCGIKSDDSLWCWGANMMGQLTATATSTASQSTGVLSWCSSPAGSPGAIVYNSTQSLLQFCDGAGWVGIRGGVAPPPAPEGIPTLGLLAHWPMEEGSGTTTASTVGTNNGTLTGGPTWVTGRVGSYAVNLDGTNDYIVMSTAVPITNNKTVSFWIYPTSSTGDRQVFYASDGSGSDYMIVSFWNSRIYASVDNVYSAINKRSNITLPLNNWYHVAITKITNDIQKIYINGADVTENGFDYYSEGGAGTTLSSNSTDFQGYMDDVRVYDRALGPTEIQALANQ